MSKHLLVALLCSMSLVGCASFVSGGTGTAPVGTASGTRSLGQMVIDKSIERTASVNLYKLDNRFRQSRINMNSFFGSVLLTGQVPDESLKKLAEDNLKAMTDVKSVHNYITVGNQISYNTIMQDTGVTANTRALIARAAVISDSKVSVHTEDGVLYVMGRLNNAEIADLNQVLSQVGNITKVVMLVDNIENPSQSPAATSTPVAVENKNSTVGTASTTPYTE